MRTGAGVSKRISTRGPGAGIWGCASAGLLSFAFACTPFAAGTDELPAQVADSDATATTSTASLTPALPGRDWSCLGAAVPRRPPTVSVADRVIYSVQAVDIGTGQSVPGAQVRVCGLADVDCMQPLMGPVIADSDGWFDVPLYEGFTGYLEFSGPDLVPGLLFLSEALTAESSPDYPYLLMSNASRDALSRVIGVPLDPELGIIATRSFDCQGVTAPDVSVTKTGPGVAFYFIGGLPTVMENKTGPEGFGGFINVPTGVALVDVLTPGGVSIAGTLSFVVRPGWTSTSFVYPQRPSER